MFDNRTFNRTSSISKHINQYTIDVVNNYKPTMFHLLLKGVL